MKKLMKNIQNILNNKIILSLVILIGLTGCPKNDFDYVYNIGIENSTSDSLKIVIGNINSNISISGYASDDYILNPMDTAFFLGTLTINEGQNASHYVLIDNYQWDTVHVYRNDSLKAAWFFPAKEETEDIHDFFNFNSWKNWLNNSREGIVMFTIYESDLKRN